MYGTWRKGARFASIDTLLVPCASQISTGDGVKIGGEDSCVWDKNEVDAYLGREYNMLVYYNQAGFRSQKYGEERIERKSVLDPRWTITNLPIWTEGFVNKHSLEDETHLFQLGQ